jgi:hypothetical protein
VTQASPPEKARCKIRLHLHGFDLHGIALQFTSDSHLVTDVILYLAGIIDLVDLTVGHEYRCCAPFYALHSAMGMLIFGALRPTLLDGNIPGPLAGHSGEAEYRQHQH